MDARCVDRPAAVLRACGQPALDRVLADRLVTSGYDVHLDVDLLPGAGDGPHPRLHAGRSDVDGVPDTLSVDGRHGPPLALVVGVRPDDVAREARMLRGRMGPLRAAGVLVLDDATRWRGTRSGRSATSDLDPRITVTTVASWGVDEARLARTAARALERLLAHLGRTTR